MSWYERYFTLCKGCPAKARYFDPDGYWCCSHPEAGSHMNPPEPGRNTKRDEAPVPFTSMESCPIGYWKKSKNGEPIPKNQSELF